MLSLRSIVRADLHLSERCKEVARNVWGRSPKGEGRLRIETSDLKMGDSYSEIRNFHSEIFYKGQPSAGRKGSVSPDVSAAMLFSSSWTQQTNTIRSLHLDGPAGRLEALLNAGAPDARVRRPGLSSPSPLWRDIAQQGGLSRHEGAERFRVPSVTFQFSRDRPEPR